MAAYIAKAFQTLGITITPREQKAMIDLLIRFETRGTHIIAFNSQHLGVYPVAFKDEDRAAIFDLFNVKERDVAALVKQIPTINTDFKVISDPFNLLCIWVIHLSLSMIPKPQEQAEFALAVAKYLHYRYFTSLVNHFFPHGTNEKIMAATISRLSRKYDIITEGTWRRLIEARCRTLVSAGTLHYNSFVNGEPDDKITYILSDTQSRMRERVKNISNSYHDVKLLGAEIKSRSATLEIDGEKILVHTVSALDTMVTNIYAEVNNVRSFVEPVMVRSMARQFTAISASGLNQVLTKFSALAKEQNISKELDDAVILRKDDTKTVGTRVLVRDIIQSAYSYCIRHNIPLSNKADAYIRIKNVFSSSRIADEAINDVKERTGILIDDLMDTNRETTKASMRIAFLMYICFKGLKYL